MSRADHCPRFYGEAVEELHAEESGYFPVVPMPALPNERLWELYSKRHDLTDAERVEWDNLTMETEQ